MIDFYFQGQKANLRVKMAKKWYLARTGGNNCNTSFVCDFDWRIHFRYYFDDSRSFSRSIWRSHLWTHVFHQTQVGRSVIPLFDVILTGEYVYLLISVILQDKTWCEHYYFLDFKMNAVTKKSKIMFNIGPTCISYFDDRSGIDYPVWLGRLTQPCARLSHTDRHFFSTASCVKTTLALSTKTLGCHEIETNIPSAYEN